MWKFWPLIFLLTACKGPQGAPGKSGTNGIQGSPGGSLLTYQGVFTNPLTQNTVIQNVPGLNLERGDIVNVYLQWNSGIPPYPWQQIGATWVGGAAGFYSINGTIITITVYTNVQTGWLINVLEQGSGNSMLKLL